LNTKEKRGDLERKLHNLGLSTDWRLIYAVMDVAKGFMKTLKSAF